MLLRHPVPMLQAWVAASPAWWRCTPDFRACLRTQMMAGLVTDKSCHSCHDVFLAPLNCCVLLRLRGNSNPSL